jgi:hypothetical protein
MPPISSRKSPTGWKRPLEDPIPLPRGRQLVILQDAADYIMKLSKADRDLPEWQAAGEALIMAAEGRGPLMHARVGMLRALNHGKPAPEQPPRRKAVKKYRIAK